MRRTLWMHLSHPRLPSWPTVSLGSSGHPAYDSSFPGRDCSHTCIGVKFLTADDSAHAIHGYWASQQRSIWVFGPIRVACGLGNCKRIFDRQSSFWPSCQLQLPRCCLRLPPIAPEAIHSWAKLSTSPQASVSSSPSCGDGFAMGLCSSATYHGPMLRGLEPDSVGDEIVDVPLRYEESAASKTPQSTCWGGLLLVWNSFTATVDGPSLHPRCIHC